MWILSIYHTMPNRLVAFDVGMTHIRSANQ